MKIDVIESELNCLYNRLFDAEDPMEMDVLTETEKKPIYDKIKELESKKNDKFKKLYEEKIKSYPAVLNNPLLKELIKEDYHYNYLLICLLEKAPIIYSDNELAKIICKCISDDGLEMLLKLDSHVFENKELLSLINHPSFRQLENIFSNPILMNDVNFINYLLDKIKTNSIPYGTYYSDTKHMEQALRSKLDYELVLSIGCYDTLKAYLQINVSSSLFENIANIKNDNLMKLLLSVLFNSSKEKINILAKFFTIQEVREQLIDPDSFYYHLLITPLLQKNNENFYGTKEALFSFNTKVFYDFDFNGMIHYFDTLVNHYIYYYEKGQIQYVPIVIYISSIRKRIEKYNNIHDIVYSAENSEDEMDILEEKYKNVLNKGFFDLCIDALDKNKNKVLSNEEIDYWSYLLHLDVEENEKLTFSLKH